MVQIDWLKLVNSVYILIQLPLLSLALLGKNVEVSGNDIDNNRTGSSYEFLNSPEDWLFGGFTIPNEERCSSNDEFKVLMLVHSALGNFGCRSVYRKYVPKAFRVVFLLGLGSPSDQDEIQLESEIHGDIVQGSFIDSYRNLTRKHVMGLTWAGLHCSTAPWVMKSDDDIVHNYTAILNHLESFRLTEEMSSMEASKGFILGHFNGRRIQRNRTSKWYVSKDENPDEFYPESFIGCTYFTTIDTIKELLNQVPSTPFFWIDVIYVTGLLQSKCPDIHLYRLHLLWNLNESRLSEWISDSGNCYWPFKISKADRNRLNAAFHKLQICENH